MLNVKIHDNYFSPKNFFCLMTIKLELVKTDEDNNKKINREEI